MPVNIRDHLCYPKFTCMHLNFPEQEQLMRNLARYRQTDALIHLFDNANNFDALDEELHSKLFHKKQDGIRITWKYINTMVQHFYDKNGSLPLNAEKSIISTMILQ